MISSLTSIFSFGLILSWNSTPQETRLIDVVERLYFCAFAKPTWQILFKRQHDP
jgi:hypothetical protein